MAITMEELKQKAQRYDEALEKAKRLYEKGTITESLCHIFPELKESEDVQHRKWILEYLYDGLRKSDEQFKEQFKCAIGWLEKQGEKHADKIKAKFHEGDWIISNNKKYIYQVVEVKRGIYVVRDNADNREYHIGIESAERDGRLWNISDAKDGDVLVDVYENTGIFQKNDDFDWTSYCSLGCNGGFQNFKVEHESENAHPATKEQCDQFEKAMTDAGWKFDFEKKELKKLGQQEVTKMNAQVKDSAWSEEDDYNLQCWIAKAVNDIQNGNVGRNQELIDWLKSLKQRIGG